MATETITLEIDSELARTLNSLSAEFQQRLLVLFGIWLKQYAQADGTPLEETMNAISEKAKSRGLTPEILESILRRK
ncbi:MAG TPA: hypothetical protein DC047_00945 [Blastocatellia bacterium]|nr:hypothetical protein [Blastocatellia bacterium]